MNLRNAFWSVCSAISPGMHLTLKSMLGARRSRAGERRAGQLAYSREFIHRRGSTVLNGPFRGLRFPAEAFGHNLVPKLTGAYEFQLHPFIETLVSRSPAQIVDIGSAEGYYANGLALRLPAARVHAFDAAPGERAVCLAVATENGLVERVTVHGICTPEWLQTHLRPGDLVFSDCEGGEDVLLDPAAVPALQDCDLLVETHDDVVPKITARLLERFERTHEVHRFPEAAAPSEALPLVEGWTADDYARALAEGRAVDQEWLVLLARVRG